MHKNHTLLFRWRQVAANRLNFGSYCTLCARSAQTDLDLCLSCEYWLRTRTQHDNPCEISSLCLACGDALSLTCFEHTADKISDGHSATAREACTPELLEISAGSSDRAGSMDYCHKCAAHSGEFFTRIVAPYRYSFPVDGLIKRVKYSNDRQFSRVLGTLLGRAVESDVSARAPDVLVPMPLHLSKWRYRGYNQAQDIAIWCAHYLKLPVAPSSVSRLVDTGSLAGLNRAERRQRILGAFRANECLAGKRVAIVDDVMTTGASARELAREIYDSGALSVELWVLARTSKVRLAPSI